MERPVYTVFAVSDVYTREGARYVMISEIRIGTLNRISDATAIIARGWCCKADDARAGRRVRYLFIN